MHGKTMQSASRVSARARLLAAADELFYEDGINTVGIDRVIERAGVAKASLYDCFGSKDELIRAYLESRNAARQARIEERIARYDTPEQKILGIFDMLGEMAAQPDFRGCAFVRAGADGNASEKVKGACAQSRQFLLGQFTSLARAAGATDPELLGQQLVLLYDGASIAAHLDRNHNAGALARELAARILPSAGPARPAATKNAAAKKGGARSR
jgi:AcrR family transcriptional regulator